MGKRNSFSPVSSKNYSFLSLWLIRARHMTVTFPWSHTISCLLWTGAILVRGMEAALLLAARLEAFFFHLAPLWIVRTALRKGRSFLLSRREKENLQRQRQWLHQIGWKVLTALNGDERIWWIDKCTRRVNNKTSHFLLCACAQLWVVLNVYKMCTK